MSPEVRKQVAPLLHTLVIETATGSKEPASSGLIGLGVSHSMLTQSALHILRGGYSRDRELWYDASALAALVGGIAPPHAAPGV
ncbi:MAG: hypothetical protein JSR76_01455 [Verrucomicrobia bacterium]|nr:hypothetical protein [Verrucomicrobiota bacterium]